MGAKRGHYNKHPKVDKSIDAVSQREGTAELNQALKECLIQCGFDLKAENVKLFQSKMVQAAGVALKLSKVPKTRVTRRQVKALIDKGIKACEVLEQLTVLPQFDDRKPEAGEFQNVVSRLMMASLAEEIERVENPYADEGAGLEFQQGFQKQLRILREALKKPSFWFVEDYLPENGRPKQEYKASLFWALKLEAETLLGSTIDKKMPLSAATFLGKLVIVYGSFLGMTPSDAKSYFQRVISQ